MRSVVASSCLATALLCPAPAHSTVIILQNDNFTSGSLAYFQDGFVVGEYAAVTLGPVNDTFTVQKVQFLFGPDSGSVTIGLHLWIDSGADIPGLELYNYDVTLAPSSTGIQEIDLTGESIIIPGPTRIRVGISLQHTGLPAVARDSDGISARGRNWIRDDNATWLDSVDAGVPGDWVIRLQIDTTGSVVTGCTQPSDCGPGEICLGTTCRRVCAAPAECGGGEVCFRGLCTPSCATTAECQGGEQCEGQVCQTLCASNVMCPGGELCYQNLCRTICDTHADCAAEEHCEKTACVLGDRPADDDPGGCGCNNRPIEPGPLALLVALWWIRVRRRARS